MNLATVPDRLDPVVVALVLALVLSFTGVVVFSMENPDDYSYRYEVKAEQVSSSSYDIENTEIVNYNTLTDAEKELLYEAYHDQSDGLIGGSETVEVDEKLELDEDPQWKVVEIDGVRLLVGISSAGSVAEYSNTHAYMLILSVFGLIGSIFGLITVAALKDY